MPTTNHDCFQNSTLQSQRCVKSSIFVCNRKLNSLAFGLLLYLGSLALAQDAADPFDSPLAPLPPQLLDVNQGVVELAMPGIHDEQDSKDTLQQEFAELRGLIDQLHEKDSARANEIVSTIRQSISKQSQIAQQLVESLPSKRFSSKHPFTIPRLGQVKRYVAFLEQLGEKELAKSFEEKVEALERYGDGSAVGLPGDAVEVHHVAIRQGTPLPEKYADGVDRLTTGFAEVQVNHSGAPIILLLTAKEPIVWKVSEADSARIFAVVIDSTRPQKVLGLKGTAILHANDFTNLPATLFEANGMVPGNNIESLYEVAKTRYRDTAYAGQPVVLGMSNKDWAEAYLISQTEALIEQCQTRTRLAQAKQLQELKFRALYTQILDGNRWERAIGDFNVAGPVASSLVPLPNSDSELLATYTTSVDTGAKEFGLTQDGELVVKTTNGDKTVLTPVPLPQQLASQGIAFQAMAFDNTRSRLVLAARHIRDEVKLFALELSTGSWSKIGDYDVRRILALAYVPREDAIWAMAVNNTSSGAQLLQLDDDGKVIRRTPVSDVVEEGLQLDGLSSAQLLESSGYAILIGNRSRALSPVKDRVFDSELFVISPASGELIYRNQLHVNNGKDPLRAIAKAQKSTNISDHILLRLADRFVSSEKRLRNGERFDHDVVDTLTEMRSAKAILSASPAMKNERSFIVYHDIPRIELSRSK